jgi:DNA polymerase-3 subunit alpha
VKFVSLHGHSTFSYMDGHGLPAAHVERVSDLGMEAVALTEHGNVSSHVKLEKAALKSGGVKPIFGAELYTEPAGGPYAKKCHLTVLAATLRGYQNLNRVVSRSWSEGFYRWPTASGRMLADHSEDMIVLSGCADSLLSCSLDGGKMMGDKGSYVAARELAAKFRALYGDRYYLECQIFPELERTRTLNPAFERLSREMKIPLVATADVHYPHPNDSQMRSILHAAGRGAGSVAAQEASWEYGIPADYPTSDAYVLKRLRGTGLSKLAASEALANTAEIAARCSVTLPKAERLRYPTPPGVSTVELVWQWLREGWQYRVSHGNRRIIEHRDEYVSRLRYEMDSIAGKDFCDYFLMLSDVVRWAKDNGIPVGPARGSAAASLVSYLMRITEIDPLEFPLMQFERFIAPDREDEPDVDLDFDDDRRHEVRAHVAEIYGEDRVGNIGTYTKYKGKNSLQDVARVFPHLKNKDGTSTGVPFADVEAIKNVLVERSGGDSRGDFTLLDTIEMFPQAKEAYLRNEKYLQYALKLQGNYRGMSVHAAGLVVNNTPIAETCAMYTRPKKNSDGTEELISVVAVDKYDAAYLGLMKADFLGLTTMGMIRIALAIAGLTLDDLYAIPAEDPDTLESFRKNDVVGIFQFEGRATRLVCREVKPRNFMELSDVNTLSRPGPLFSGATAEYIAVRQGKKKPTRYHPLLDEILKDTKGQVIYQEQVLNALRIIGGLPVARVHEIRKIISQKLGEAQFNKSAEDFVEGAKRLHGMDEPTARKVWGKLVTSATYVFNIAHSISYARLGQWCMWLKTHHPVAFYTAQLQKTKPEKWPRLIRDAESHGIAVRGVDPKRSGLTWTADVSNGAVLAGWTQLKGVGYKVARKILEYAKENEISTVDDLVNVNGIGEKTIDRFRGQMGDDPFGLRRTELALNAIRSAIAEGSLRLPSPTHTSDAIIGARAGGRVTWVGMVKLKEYKDALEDERARSGKEIEDIKKEMKRPDLVTSCVLHCYDDGEEDVYLRVTRFDYPRFAAALEGLRPGHDVILARARRSRGGFGASLYVKSLVVIDPEEDDGEETEDVA